MSPPSFPPTLNQRSSGESQTSVDSRLLGLSVSYLWYAVSTFNTCSRGPTHRSLTDINGGYNLGGAGFPHPISWPSQPTVLCFPPKGPIRTQVIHSQHKPLMKVMLNTYDSRPVAFWPLGVYQYLYPRLAMANIFQILSRSSRNRRKVLIMQLRLQSTPINLMHNSS
jgi:hypothetical protein